MSKDRDSSSTTEVAPTPAESPSPAKDVIVVGGPSEDGAGVSILRVREDRVEAGELRAATPGKPITGELVKLSPRQESDRVFDVEVLAKGPMSSGPSNDTQRAAPTRKGPAKVASDAYRTNWDGIFGSKAPTSGNSDLN